MVERTLYGWVGWLGGLGDGGGRGRGGTYVSCESDQIINHNHPLVQPKAQQLRRPCLGKPLQFPKHKSTKQSTKMMKSPQASNHPAAQEETPDTWTASTLGGGGWWMVRGGVGRTSLVKTTNSSLGKAQQLHRPAPVWECLYTDSTLQFPQNKHSVLSSPRTP